MKYKISKNHDRFYDLYINDVKFNYRCARGTVDNTFSCGKTPEERKKNYEKQHPEKAKSPNNTQSKSDENNRVPKKLDSNAIKNKIINGVALTQEEKDFVKTKISQEKPSTNKEKATQVSRTTIATSNISAATSSVRSASEKARSEMKTGKVSKQTYQELKSAINDLKEQKSRSATASTGSNNKNTMMLGLEKIRSEIEKAGGPENFFETADTHSKEQDERKPINSEQMMRILKLYTNTNTFKIPYKEENGIKWYKQDNKETSVIVGKIGSKVAAYVLKASDPDNPKEPYTTIVSSTDFKGQGVGKKAMLEFYNNYPDMIKKTGGLTPMGKKAYMETLKTIYNTHKQDAAYPDFKTPSKLDKEVENILASIQDDVMASIKKTTYFSSKPTTQE
jgi:hypothetical protein